MTPLGDTAGYLFIFTVVTTAIAASVETSTKDQQDQNQEEDEAPVKIRGSTSATAITHKTKLLSEKLGIGTFASILFIAHGNCYFNIL